MRRVSSISRGGGENGRESVGRRTMKPTIFDDIVITMSQVAPHLKVTEASLMNPTTDFVVIVWSYVLEVLNIDLSYISQPALYLPKLQLELYDGFYQYGLLFSTMSKVMKDFDIIVHLRDLTEPKSKRTASLIRRFISVLNSVFNRDEFIDKLMKARRYKQAKLDEMLEKEENLRQEWQRFQEAVREDDAAVQKVFAETKENSNALKERYKEKAQLAKERDEMKAAAEKKKSNLDAIYQKIAEHEGELQKLKAACVSSPDRLQREADMKLQEVDSVNAELLDEEAREEAIAESINIVCKWKEFFAGIHASLSEMSDAAKAIKEKESEIHEVEKIISSLGKDFNAAIQSKDFRERAQKSNEEMIHSLKVQHEAKMASLKKELNELKVALDKYVQQLHEKEVIATGLQEEHQSVIMVKSEQDKSVSEYKESALREYAEMMKKLETYKAQVSNAASDRIEVLQKDQKRII